MLHIFIWLLHMLQVYVSNVSPVSDVCCKCFYLDVAYTAVVIHICCKRMFQLFQHVSICYSRCGQCPNGRALPVKVHVHMQSARAGQHPTDTEPSAPAPQGVVPHGGACGQVNSWVCVLCFLPLSCIWSLLHGHRSRIGARALCSLSLALGYARCAPSLALGYARCAPSLMHAAGRDHAHVLPSRRNSSSRRRHGAQQQQEEARSATACVDVRTCVSIRMFGR
jgi:hypothetical protein